MFQTTSDAEVILSRLARCAGVPLEEAVGQTMASLQGGWAVILLTPAALVAFRDRYGIRPLCFGHSDGVVVVASETCALTALGIEDGQELSPGELLLVDKAGVVRRRPQALPSRVPCAFEYIYYARPDSELFDRNVHLVRKEVGRRLFQERPVEADVVIAAPDSGTSAAMGFAEAAGLPFEIGLVKNRYVGRSFIHPDDGRAPPGGEDQAESQPPGAGRKAGGRPGRLHRAGHHVPQDGLPGAGGGRQGSAHVRGIAALCASVPLRHRHFVPGELIAAQRTIEDIRRYIGADSLYYLSVRGCARAIGVRPDQLCLGCMTGEVPRAPGRTWPPPRGGRRKSVDGDLTYKERRCGHRSGLPGRGAHQGPGAAARWVLKCCCT